MTPTQCLIIVPHANHKYAVRWQAAHPLAVYAVLERWLREGVIDVLTFGALLDFVTKKEVAT